MADSAPRESGPAPRRSVLFDLDGTFADTAPDLAFALNRLLRSRGCAPLPFETIRPWVSHGGRALIRLGFGLEPGDTDYEPLRQEFLCLYQANISRETRPFPGIGTLLGRLEERAIPWGIVTNKPGWLTDPLMERLGLSARAACIVSGDTTAHAKPHPEPIRHACRLTGSDPAHCLYVGDAERDVRAGRAAGTRTLIALFGYIGAEDRPRDWGADGLIHRPSEILDWLEA